MSMLSPWPTSMAVISSMPRSVRGAKGCHSSKASSANTTPVAAILQARDARWAMARPISDAAIAMASHRGGPGIRQLGSHWA